jgi:hypothetical protein
MSGKKYTIEKYYCPFSLDCQYTRELPSEISESPIIKQTRVDTKSKDKASITSDYFCAGQKKNKAEHPCIIIEALGVLDSASKMSLLSLGSIDGLAKYIDRLTK